MPRTPTSTTPSAPRRRRVSLRRTTLLLLLSVVVACTGCISVASAQAPDFPEFDAPVVDDAGVVPDEAERTVNDDLIEYQRATGNQIAVAVIDTTGNASLEDYTIDLAKEWGVGSAEDDNGVLLLIAVEDRRTRIEVGEGIEGELTDIESGRIIRDNINPLLRDGEYGDAISVGTRAIQQAIGAAVTPVDEGETPRGDPRRTVPSWAFTVLPFVVFPLLFGRRRRRASPVFWGGGTVRRDNRRDRRLGDDERDGRRRRRDDDDDDGDDGWLGAAILGSILLGGGHRGGGWGGSGWSGGGGGGFDFGGGGGGDFGGGGASGDW